MTTFLHRAMVCAMVAVSACAGAHAVPVQPGQAVALSGTTSQAETWLNATQSSPSVDSFFTVLDASGNAVFEGRIIVTPVVSNDLGTARINYIVLDTVAVGSCRIATVAVSGYTGYQTNVNWRSDGTGIGIGPSQAVRSADGELISFGWVSPTLPSGTQTRSFFVQTDTPYYDLVSSATIRLNTGEFTVISGLYGPVRSECPGDANGDGVVNFVDLNGVLSDFGEECP